MLRKGFLIIILFVYLAASAGVVVNFHYCMNQLASLSFSHEADHEDGTCGGCGMDKSENSCCKDHLITYKIEDCHQPAASVSEPAVCVSFLHLFIQADTPDALTASQSLVVFDHSPPSGSFNKRYRDLQVFRI